MERLLRDKLWEYIIENNPVKQIKPDTEMVMAVANGSNMKQNAQEPIQNPSKSIETPRVRRGHRMRF